MTERELKALMAAVVFNHDDEGHIADRAERAVRVASMILGLLPEEQAPKKARKKREEQPFEIAMFPGLNAEAFNLFVEHRKQIGKPLTSLGMGLAAKRLAEAGNAAFQAAVVNRSIEGRWTGLFPESTPGQVKAPRHVEGANVI